MVSESIFIPFAEGEQLHVQRFYVNAAGPALLLLPGSIENGHIFYSKSGKGFAPWMAEQGFDVFVADLRGRGKSTPKISRASTFGQDEALKEEYPAYFAKVMEIKQSNRVFVATHSWAGVNVLAFWHGIQRMWRFPQRCFLVQNATFPYGLFHSIGG